MPYSSMKDVPKALKTAGLNLSQANKWAAIYDKAKTSGTAISPAAVAWTQFKRLYKKVGKKWFKRAEKLAQDPVGEIIFTHWGSQAIKMKPEELAQKILELSKKYCPDIPVEIAIDNSKFGPFEKGEKQLKPKEQAFIEKYALSNYLGSKRAYTKAIFNYIPSGTKTIFDPMTGSSHVLIEAARRGIQVIGNDLSPIAFLYSAGIFQGSKLEENDIKRLKNPSPSTGWLSKSGLMRPKSKESKRLLDGLAINAWKNFSEGKKRAALAVVSLLVQHYFRGFQAFISEEEPYSQEQIQGDLDTAIKEVNGLIEAVGGRGKIFNRDILKEKIPQADVIYFDPPYFPAKIKHNIEYFKHYKIANSFLMQKTYQPQEPSSEAIAGLLSRLAPRAKTLIVSSASPSKINWEGELGKLKKNIKRIGLAKTSTGSQPQGHPGHIDKPLEVKENLFCASNEEIRVTRKSEISLFRLGEYDPTKVNDAQLSDDLKLVAAKWSSILNGRKTEFKNKEQCIDLAETVMREVLRRGKITFHSKYMIKK